jgi:hypothetical protein
VLFPTHCLVAHPLQAHVASQTTALATVTSNPNASEVAVQIAAVQLQQAHALLSRMTIASPATKGVADGVLPPPMALDGSKPLCVKENPAFKFSAAEPPTCGCTACTAFMATFARFKMAPATVSASVDGGRGSGRQSPASGRRSPRNPSPGAAMGAPLAGASGASPSAAWQPNRSSGSSTPKGKSASALDMLLYKTAPCRRFNETGYCAYGADCGFAHGEADLRNLTSQERNELIDMQRREAEQRRAEEAVKAAAAAALNPPVAGYASVESEVGRFADAAVKAAQARAALRRPGDELPPPQGMTAEAAAASWRANQRGDQRLNKGRTPSPGARNQGGQGGNQGGQGGNQGGSQGGSRNGSRGPSPRR